MSSLICSAGIAGVSYRCPQKWSCQIGQYIGGEAPNLQITPNILGLSCRGRTMWEVLAHKKAENQELVLAAPPNKYYTFYKM